MYVFYNHFDSYLSGLGVQLINDTIAAFVSGEHASKWKAAFNDSKLIVVNCTNENCHKPLEEDIANLACFTNLTVGDHSTDKLVLPGAQDQEVLCPDVQLRVHVGQ